MNKPKSSSLEPSWKGSCVSESYKKLSSLRKHSKYLKMIFGSHSNSKQRQKPLACLFGSQACEVAGVLPCLGRGRDGAGTFLGHHALQGCQFSDFSLISDLLRIKKTC